MKPNTDRQSPHRFGRAKRRIAGVLFLLCCHGVAWAQSPGVSALMQGHGRTGRAPDGVARQERDRVVPKRAATQREARARALRYRAERDAGRSQRGGLSAEERRRLRQSLYELGREMYHGG
ncbi:hypothetical protein [Cupriavidus sp. AU9028]|uniref:hypothetical protein n=1 Tax=Cupriavidus sp. AU9028 TaxID=2871157 RepID=UPI001C95337D|nr:hypothetical protein [Cupriavidus sp. AU9028]MBY4897582.1 hypothetical protein [Cupriavidus sp. AU9028]